MRCRHPQTRSDCLFLDGVAVVVTVIVVVADYDFGGQLSTFF